MVAFVKGDIIVLPFPFSDLSANKRRPALVLASLPGDDIVVCQITSQIRPDPYSVAIEDTDFVNGGLKQSSLVRVSRIFTAESSIVRTGYCQLLPILANSVNLKLFLTPRLP